MKCFVYVLFNRNSAKIYIGQTSNLTARLIEHDRKRGNHYTVGFSGKWELIYKEEYESRTKAIIREKQLKSYQGRKFIKELLKSNPL
jgi:putative endonuclease